MGANVRHPDAPRLSCRMVDELLGQFSEALCSGASQVGALVRALFRTGVCRSRLLAAMPWASEDQIDWMLLGEPKVLAK